MQLIVTSCDWAGHDDDETKTEETCDASYSSDSFGPRPEGWYSTGDEDFCPTHAPFICRGCDKPNMDTLASPNAKDWCIDCTGEAG